MASRSLFSSFVDYCSAISDVFELHNLKLLAAKLGLIVVAFLAPIFNILIGMFVLVLFDLITGLLAARKKKQKITSSKLSRTVSKLLVYSITVLLVHVINQTLLFGVDLVPLAGLVTSYIALTEFVSILENLDKISGRKSGLVAALIFKLSNDGRKLPKQRKK